MTAAVPLPVPVAARKRHARGWAKARRGAMQATDRAAADRAICKQLDRHLPFDRTIAAFWPLAGEIDLKPWIESRVAAGAGVLLPRMTGRSAPLAFHCAPAIDELVEGPFGVFEPPASAPVQRPDVVLVPLLAVDRLGQRLGYGGGYYDRTLAQLRTEGPVHAIGVGYGWQRLERLPAEATDRRLDAFLEATTMIDFTSPLGRATA